MQDPTNQQYVIPLLIITALGSIIDCIQAMWILTMAYKKIKVDMYRRIKDEVLEDMRKVDKLK